MRKLIIFVTLLWLSPVCFSQLTQDQKVADFNSLVALYNRNYGPLDWKERAFHFDALDARPSAERPSALGHAEPRALLGMAAFPGARLQKALGLCLLP